MILVDVNLDVWCRDYELTVETEKCVKCGKPLTTNIPIAVSGYRGLKSETHGCGPQFDHYVMVPIKETEKEWEQVKYGRMTSPPLKALMLCH